MMPDSKAEPEWAAFIAMDWADQKHYWKLQDASSQQCQRGEIAHTPEALDSWAAELYTRFGGRPIAVCLEQARGPLVYMLSKYSHLVLYPVHATTAARFRSTFYPSGSKNDPSDTDLLLQLLLQHRQHLRRLDPDTPETRLLQMLVEQRRRWVNEKTACSNRLTAWLKMYFPQVLDWIDDIDSPLGCALLSRWPTLEQLQRTQPPTLRQFFAEHNCRSQQRIEERLEAIYKALPAVQDKALLEAGPAIAAGMIDILEAVARSIADLDQRIEALVSAHPERFLFAGLPGAGPVLLPRLLAAFGSNRERFQTAHELESYSGIAPVTQRSGRTQCIHFRHSCPKFLRQTFHEFAAHSRRKSTWARAFYESQIDKGKGHHAAVRALAFKWIRILFRCWKDRQPYDEATYLRALRQHHSPLPTRIQWIQVAGFQKPVLKKT